MSVVASPPDREDLMLVGQAAAAAAASGIRNPRLQKCSLYSCRVPCRNCLCRRKEGLGRLFVSASATLSVPAQLTRVSTASRTRSLTK
eukprot:1724077-Rhodomonas_salina.1